MSTLRTNNIQVGQSGTATHNFTLAVPVSPNGTISLARGNQGATSADIINISADNGVTLARFRHNISVVSANVGAAAGVFYICTASMTLTLPASPAVGDIVGFSNRSSTTSIVIARNGTNIMGLAEDMTVDANHVGFTLLYSDATRGWVIV
jgi:hypothetical protein